MSEPRTTDRKSVSLTERAIRDARPGKTPYILWDKDLRGFGCKISVGGAKSFLIDYRIDGRQRRATIARVGELYLKGARERAASMLADIRIGELDPLARKERAAAEPTVSDGIERFFREFVPHRIRQGRMVERTAGEYRRQCRSCVLPSIGKLKIAAVTRHDVERMVRPLPPSQRNRVLALASRLFSYFESLELRPQNSNPARYVEKAREQPRDRVLSSAELGALNEALRGYIATSPASVAAIIVTALTGLRIGEVLAMRWQDIDRDSGRLTLPQTKTGARVHTLPTAAFVVLDRLPRLCEWCFSATGTAPVSYKTVRIVFAEACEAAGISDCRLHDLRRTAATTAAASGVGVTTLRDLLGHQSVAMAARYARIAGDEVRRAREETGATIAAAMGTPIEFFDGGA